MKITIFGASGGVGSEAVRRAVAGGHEVTAFVRTPSKVAFSEEVRVVQGDATDREAVTAALHGQEAVVSALASSDGLKKSTGLRTMVGNIVAGMTASGVYRIAYCASAGVDGELTGAVGSTIQWVLRHPLADHRAALKIVADAGLDATVARPTGLTDDPFDPAYLKAFTGMPSSARSIPRASVADFLITALEQPDVYSGTSVGLALDKA